MKWDDLKIFLSVARTGRLLAAGRVLGLDPATVGRRVATLERSLGSKLFDRSPQGYALTGAGHRLVSHAENMEVVVEEAYEDAGGQSDSLTGTVRIGAPDGLANYLLPQATASLAAGNPALKVQIAALPRIFSLSRREADLAIAVSHPSAGRLRVQKIADYHLHAYVSRSLLVRTGAVTETDQLGALTGIGYIPDMIFDKELDYFATFGPDFQPTLTSNSLIVQLNWTRAGDGYCILPDFVAREYPDLTRILGDRISLRRSYYLLRHEDDRRVARINRTSEHLVEFLRREFAAVEKWSKKCVH